MIVRELYSSILSRINKGKAIIVTGPRQTGKTTLLKRLIEDRPKDALYLNADEPDVRSLLGGASSTELRRLIGPNRIVCIDEAQRVSDIGITLKLITDQIPEVQLIVTGSSALELGQRIFEPLTGRKYSFHLFPLSFKELEDHFGYLEERRHLEARLVYGCYPDVINHPAEEEEILRELTESYLFKDIFNLNDIRKPDLLAKLVEALALQVGHEVNYNELGQLTASDEKTVKRYIDFLEKAFVVFRLRALSRNARNEIKRSRKVYFYDNGIRNAVIKNFNPLSLRPDVGSLWENYLVSERMKRNEYSKRSVNMYFWRTKQQQEIDLVEEAGGKFSAYEFKWNVKKTKKWPSKFTENYPARELKIINPENYGEFLTNGRP